MRASPPRTLVTLLLAAATLSALPGFDPVAGTPDEGPGAPPSLRAALDMAAASGGTGARVTTYTPAGPVTTEVPFHVGLAMAEDGLATAPSLDMPAQSRGDEAPPMEGLGIGSSHLPLPGDSCARVQVSRWALGDHVPPMVLSAVPASPETGVLGDGTFCPAGGRGTQVTDATWAEVVIDGTAQDIFRPSELVRAQAWVHPPAHEGDVRQFEYAVLRGEGRLVVIDLLGWPNIHIVHFYGDGATVELHATAPPTLGDVPLAG